ncbi:MAG: ABC transporter permease, partial [Bacteroidota bacterium]
MNLELFIARRIASQRGNAFSARIMRIAIAAIALSIAVMIVATALSAGFKHEISEKIFGFWSHIQIRHYKVDSFVETVPIDRNQPFYAVYGEGETREIRSPLLEGGPVDYIEEKLALGLFPYDAHLQTQGGVKHIQVYANKAGIIQIKSELEGIILKGVSDDFDWTFLNRFIIRGDTLSYQRPSPNREILISETTARRLKVDTSDQFIVNFVDNGRQIGRKFNVAGIYKTGLEEFDEKFALVDIRVIQQLNGWSEDEVSGFEVFIDDIDDLDILGEYVYYNHLPQELYSSTIRELHPAIFGWLDLQDVNERVIIIIMIFVSIINMITALMILILERTNMIGVLKALGMPNRS